MQRFPVPIYLDDTEEKVAPPKLRNTSSDTRLAASNHEQPTIVATSTVWRSKLKALQKGA